MKPTIYISREGLALYEAAARSLVKKSYKNIGNDAEDRIVAATITDPSITMTTREALNLAAEEIKRLTIENATIRGALNFDRLLPDVILLDGKHYRMMTDEECADFIWKPEKEGAK